MTDKIEQAFEAGRLAAIEPVGDPIATLVARIEALESALAMRDTPSVEIPDYAPLPADPRALAVARARDTLPVQSKPKRTAAHVRAIMVAWKARNAARKYRREYDGERGVRKAFFDMWKSSHSDLRSTKAKRRRAVLKARDLQTRLHAEHKLVDRYQSKRREAEQCARDLSIKEQAQRERADRAETALAAVKARADGWPPAIRSVNVKYDGAPRQSAMEHVEQLRAMSEQRSARIARAVACAA